MMSQFEIKIYGQLILTSSATYDRAITNFVKMSQITMNKIVKKSTQSLRIYLFNQLLGSIIS